MKTADFLRVPGNLTDLLINYIDGGGQLVLVVCKGGLAYLDIARS